MKSLNLILILLSLIIVKTVVSQQNNYNKVLAYSDSICISSSLDNNDSLNVLSITVYNRKKTTIFVDTINYYHTNITGFKDNSINIYYKNISDLESYQYFYPLKPDSYFTIKVRLDKNIIYYMYNLAYFPEYIEDGRSLYEILKDGKIMQYSWAVYKYALEFSIGNCFYWLVPTDTIQK